MNYNFKMKFLPSAKLSHAYRLSRQIPKYKEPLEDTVIAFLREEAEIKNTQSNAVWELPLTKSGEKRRIDRIKHKN